jgi:hypothetical protein
MTPTQNNKNDRKLPIAKNEKVEFSADLADVDDIEAVKRAEAADNRQEHK